MSTYNIDFSDPLQPGFQIVPGRFNGPGSAAAKSSARLYGRGALEWGESVDEDIVRQLQSYASATPPNIRLTDPATGLVTNDVDWTSPVPMLSGQLWCRGTLYRKVQVTIPYVGTVDVWYRYNFVDSTPDDPVWDPASPVGSTWGPITDVLTYTPFESTNGGLSDPTVVNPALQVIGNYIYDTTENRLYRWDSLYKEVEPTWMERTWEEATLASVTPGTATHPTWSLLTWKSERWAQAGAAIVSDTPPVNPNIGDLWLDTSTQPCPSLNVWTGTRWKKMIYADGCVSMTGTLSWVSGSCSDIAININNFGTISNLCDPVAPQDAVTLSFADNRYVNVTGDTMFGTLVMQAQTGINNANIQMRPTITPMTSYEQGALNVIYPQFPPTPTPGQCTGLAWTEGPTIGVGTPRRIYINAYTTGTYDVSRFRHGDQFNSIPAISSLCSWEFSHWDGASTKIVLAMNRNIANFDVPIVSTGDITAFSDIAFKTEITPIKDALATVKQWAGILFTDKATGERRAGFIANDIEKTAPEVVKDIDGKKALAYANTTAYLAEAIKQLDEKLERLMALVEGKK